METKSSSESNRKLADEVYEARTPAWRDDRTTGARTARRGAAAVR